MIVNYSDNGKCSSCGKCCSGVLPLSDKEIKTIRRYIRIRGIKEHRHNAMTGNDLTCPFRDEARRICAIYEVRPEICRRFNCSDSIDIIMRKRDAVYKTRKDVFMRSEFYGNDELGSFLFLGNDGNAAAHHFHDFFGDRHAEAGPLDPRNRGVLFPRERIEDRLGELFAHADAVVLAAEFVRGIAIPDPGSLNDPQ